MIDGGGHERGMRSGTLHVPLIVGFGKAAELRAGRDGRARRRACARCASGCASGIQSQAADDVYVNGSLEHRLPGNLNISFAYVEGEALLMALKDVAVSSGSACTSASLEPRYVLRALGVGDELAHTSIRFGLGRFNTEEEVDYVIELVVDEVEAAARAVAALGDGSGRHRSQVASSGQRTETRERKTVMAYSEKVIDHYENPRNVGTLRQGRRRASAPAWSARRRAATS